MPAVLTHNAYGKSHVRLTKVTRHTDRHDLKELCVAIELEGDFADSYTHGDNRRVVATDTMKNTVYALAKDHPLEHLESFGQALANHFMESYHHISKAAIRLEEQSWQRMVVDSRDHPHAFVGGGTEKHTAAVTLTHEGMRVDGGIDDLRLLKTTASGFSGFIRDRYTTLPDSDDRILATLLTATWLYRVVPADWNRCRGVIRQAMLDVFARHHSLAVQQTLYAMGEAGLDACSEIEEIRLTMPNKHRVLVNLKPFGLENRNEIFVTSDEPYGLISGTLRRAESERPK
jgi:urate oxidase